MGIRVGQEGGGGGGRGTSGRAGVVVWRMGTREGSGMKCLRSGHRGRRSGGGRAEVVRGSG